jgi:anaerobic dimethyl sulfoxide reductase subunit B (iron-sulfur subunit)
MTYAFTFDASACTGCKACQVACKDKNNLPTGVLWRRVFEVSGGAWTQTGQAWTTDVFAYNLSLACNHCVHPKCAGVCPTDAYVVRPDGIVYIDESKCMGCGYCAWACPYDVPQYHPELRRMTKCNFCMDEIDQGKPPACVAACPLRALDFVEVDSGQFTVDSFQPLWEMPGAEHPFPLPAFSRTQPRLALKPHVGMANGLEKTVSNREEAAPQRAQRKTLVSFVPFVVNGFNELPLVIFTLCGQMAAGMAIFSLFLRLSIFNLLAIAFLIGLGGLASFLHLGTPLNAWRSLNHLKKSWLSREILMFGLFAANWLFALGLPGMGKFLLALTGLGLVYSMAQVYRIKAVPAWNTWRTEAAFFLSAGTLGLTGVACGAGLAEAAIPLLFLLAAQAGLILSAPNRLEKTADRLRLGLIGLAIFGAFGSLFAPGQAADWLTLPIFLLVLIQEIIGRWLFYEARQPVL